MKFSDTNVSGYINPKEVIVSSSALKIQVLSLMHNFVDIGSIRTILQENEIIDGMTLFFTFCHFKLFLADICTFKQLALSLQICSTITLITPHDTTPYYP